MKKILLWCAMVTAIFAQAQITLGSGTTAGFVPVDPFYGYSYSQQIISKTDLNASGSGTITGFRFYQSGTASIANSNLWTVYVGHTSKSAFASTTDWIPVADLTKVFEGTVTTSAGVVTVTLDTPFVYDNVNNLVIAVDENKNSYESSTSSRFYAYPATTAGALYARHDTNNISPESPVAGTLYNSRSRMTILGLNQMFSGACPVINSPAAGAVNQSATPTFSWSPVTGATGYRINLGTTPGGNDVLNAMELGNVTSYTVSSPLNYETTYYFTIVAHDGAVASSGCTERSFTTAQTPPANDACSSAQVVSGFPYSYTQSDGALATNNAGLIMNCSLGMNDGLWFRFQGNGSKITVKVTPTAWDAELAVYSGTCGSFSCVGSTDGGSTGGAETVVVNNSVAGQDYYVNVGHYSSSADNPEGPFTLEISTDAVLAAENFEKEKIKVFPNPFADQVFLSGIQDVKSISVADFSGRTVKQLKPTKELNLSDLRKGAYLMTLYFEDGSVSVHKILKK